jgi:diadenosine tetraphosphatase ApaH/serine/threonine PP2A family protein phosphatase
MRTLILSDIHGNAHALDAVLADAQARGYDQTLMLGDLVGYGAEPQRVIERVRALSPAVLIRGNHDKVCAGLASAHDFNDVARTSIEWTRRTLSRELLRFLADLPVGPVTVDGGIEICHGTPFDEDYYLFDARDAARAFDAVSQPLCFFGHTHVPAILLARHDDGVSTQLDGDGRSWSWRVPDDTPVLVNVGSVGQPRDGDPRAAYGIFDTESRMLYLHRVDYDIQGAQQKILDAGLPARLATRLEQGA